MKTPICDFLEKYSKKKSVRLHMPGHKGKSENSLDITEIPGADELFSPDGIILESEENASRLFGSAKTLYSTEGSSLCIRAMLYMAKLYAIERKKNPLILAARNAHKSFINSAALLDIDVEWIFGDNDNIFSCDFSPSSLEERIEKFSPTAVYITSPDYLGNMTDVATVGRVCKKHGVLLLVDNAHGAYLKFLGESLHPIDLGADLCADSAHKTLPVLTGGSYLHISKNAPAFFEKNARTSLSLFATTSPSYLILASLDRANKAIATSFPKKLSILLERISLLREFLLKNGFSVVGSEQTKITIVPKSFGYTGRELSDILMSKNIVCEAADEDFLVMMFSPDTGTRDFARIKNAFSGISRREPILTPAPSFLPPEAQMSPHDALFSAKETLPVDKALGRIYAGGTISCPPAIPLLIYGETITAEKITCLRYYGIKECEVVSNE